MTTTIQEKKGRFVLTAQTAMPENVEPTRWSPVVLQQKKLTDKLRFVLPADPAQEPLPKPQRARNASQNQEPTPITPDDSLEQIASNRPADVARAIHTVLMRGQGQEDVVKKAAVLLVGLGSHLAASVLQQCSEEDTQATIQVLSQLDGVTAHEKDEICEEFRQILIAGDYVIRAGRGYANDVLRRAFSYHRAQVLLKQATGEPTRGFAMLENVDPNQIVPFISKEHPQTIALILSQLDHVKAARVLNGLLPHIQETVIERLAQMDHISPSILQEVEDNLASELQAILSNEITQIGGPRAVAKILSNTSRSIETRVLKNMDQKYPKLAEEIRKGLFVFDDIANLTDREIQLLINTIDGKDLAVGLKGGSEKLQERIFANVSEEAGAKIKEEKEFSGPVRMSDVEKAQLRIVQTVRQLEESGQIKIGLGDKEDKFV
jgi:flagellar motor switch protein FliG